MQCKFRISVNEKRACDNWREHLTEWEPSVEVSNPTEEVKNVILTNVHNCITQGLTQVNSYYSFRVHSGATNTEGYAILEAYKDGERVYKMLVEVEAEVL